MSIDDCAKAAVAQWSRQTAITMVAIAGAESAYRLDAKGDPASKYPDYAPYACDGWLSHGPYQVFLGAHNGRIHDLSGGLIVPCSQANWLYDWNNSTLCAASILEAQGFRAWSAYQVGFHTKYVPAATAAVDRALSPPPPPPERVYMTEIRFATGTLLDIMHINGEAMGPLELDEGSILRIKPPPEYRADGHD